MELPMAAGLSSGFVYKMPPRILALFAFVSIITAPANAGAAPRTAADGASTAPPVIVIGFLGGFVKHDNPVHSEVQLAERLQKEYPEGVHVETYESRHGEKAREKILELLDTDHD